MPTPGSEAIANHRRQPVTGPTRPGTWTNRGLQLLDMVSEPWVPGDWFDPSTGRANGPIRAFGLQNAASGVSRGIRGAINRARNMFRRNRQPEQQGPPESLAGPSQTTPQQPPADSYSNRTDAMQGPMQAQFQGRQSRQGAGRGQVIAQRTGNVQNDRALESMAEGLLGQSPAQRIAQSGRQAREMQDRMFEGKEE